MATSQILNRWRSSDPVGPIQVLWEREDVNYHGTPHTRLCVVVTLGAGRLRVVWSTEIGDEDLAGNNGTWILDHVGGEIHGLLGPVVHALDFAYPDIGELGMRSILTTMLPAIVRRSLAEVRRRTAVMDSSRSQLTVPAVLYADRQLLQHRMDPYAFWEEQLVDIGLAQQFIAPADGDPGAVAKAKNLLLKALNQPQRDQLLANNYFDVKIPSRGQQPPGTYRIMYKRANNVQHMESGDVYCLVLEKTCPTYDIMLAVKLTLENETEVFFKTARRTPGLSISGVAETLMAASPALVPSLVSRELLRRFRDSID